MKISVVAFTFFSPTTATSLTGDVWQVPEPDEDNNAFPTSAGYLAEFAGRGCYESWGRPNPATATNEGYLRNIIEQGHWSVLEHGSVSLHFDGVSRSLTHELIRHRHFSFSQLSQRFVAPTDTPDMPVVPPLLSGRYGVEDTLSSCMNFLRTMYGKVLEEAQQAAEEAGYTGHMAKKRALEAARCVLPNMTPTKILVTGNHRAWIEFLLKRGTEAADLEINHVAVRVFNLLKHLEPTIYGNLEAVQLGPDTTIRLK